ncbi:MAG: hypothetical protein LBD66_01610 [Holosporales bacterium]|jgi:hypothetical protein|nr:hypothetical protein [Holosporales bacterium]
MKRHDLLRVIVLSTTTFLSCYTQAMNDQEGEDLFPSDWQTPLETLRCPKRILSLLDELRQENHPERRSTILCRITEDPICAQMGREWDILENWLFCAPDENERCLVAYFAFYCFPKELLLNALQNDLDAQRRIANIHLLVDNGANWALFPLLLEGAERINYLLYVFNLGIASIRQIFQYVTDTEKAVFVYQFGKQRRESWPCFFDSPDSQCAFSLFLLDTIFPRDTEIKWRELQPLNQLWRLARAVSPKNLRLQYLQACCLVVKNPIMKLNLVRSILFLSEDPFPFCRYFVPDLSIIDKSSYSSPIHSGERFYARQILLFLMEDVLELIRLLRMLSFTKYALETQRSGYRTLLSRAVCIPKDRMTGKHPPIPFRPFCEEVGVSPDSLFPNHSLLQSLWDAVKI